MVEEKKLLPKEAIEAISILIREEQKRQQIATAEISQMIRFAALGAGIIKINDKFVFSPEDFSITIEEDSCGNKTSQTSDTSTKKK